MHQIVPYVTTESEPIACLAETIIEKVREALIVINQSFCVLWANRSFYQLFSVQPHAEHSLLVDFNNESLDFLPLQNLVQQVFSSGQDTANQEVQCAGPSKKQCTLIVQATRLRLAEYSEPVILLSLEDISALKRAQLELKTYRQDLEYKVRQRTNKLENSNQYLRRIANIDSLTGIANRHSFEQVINHEWHRARREQTSLTILLIDIDFFKAYNDKNGHLYGDDCLKKVAQKMCSTLRRATDFLGRYGGEEFVAVLPNISFKGAQNLAEKIRQAVESLHLSAANTSVSKWLTVSIGMAECAPKRHQKFTSLLEAADKALYQAKAQGRNCVVNASSSIVSTEQEVSEKGQSLAIAENNSAKHRITSSSTDHKQSKKTERRSSPASL